MPTVALTLSYDGAPFSGYAKQTCGGVQRAVTVQGELENALQLVYRRPVETVCAGRTDAGVHALGQVVSFELTPDEYGERSLEKLMRSINGIAPEAMAVTAARLAPDGFSARFDARTREYRYRVVDGPVRPIFLAKCSWWVRETLDRGAMREAADLLLGEHDFKSFCLAASAEGKNTLRELTEVSLTEEMQMGESCLCVRVVGNAFLHNMVRIVVGTLVDVGAGRRDPAWVADVLEARQRSAAGQTAPPEGLVFWRVEY